MLVYLCNFGDQGELTSNYGSTFNPNNQTVPTCDSGGWYDTSVLVDAAAQFQFNQLDPAQAAGYFGAGFGLITVCFAIGLILKSILSAIRSL